MRQGHWAAVDLIGKGGHIRTVPIPNWVKAALDQWTRAAGVCEGKIFRAVAGRGKVWGSVLVEDNTANAVAVLPLGKRPNSQPWAGELGSNDYLKCLLKKEHCLPRASGVHLRPNEASHNKSTQKFGPTPTRLGRFCLVGCTIAKHTT
jgi:hypothetical protein